MIFSRLSKARLAVPRNIEPFSHRTETPVEAGMGTRPFCPEYPLPDGRGSPSRLTEPPTTAANQSEDNPVTLSATAHIRVWPNTRHLRTAPPRPLFGRA
jgi:hypothetical protein